MSPRRVNWDGNEQNKMIKELQDQSGHRSTKGTYPKVASRYRWKGLYRKIETWVKTCCQCQYRAPNWMTAELHPTSEKTLWSKVRLEVVYILKDACFFQNRRYERLPVELVGS